jgi:ATP-dependent helicase HrpB
VAAAIDLLRRLGAVDDRGRLTDDGRQLQRLPLHPRLGRILLDANGATAAARACALLSERHFVPPRHGATSCDLLAAVDRDLPQHVQQIAREIRESVRAVTGRAPADRIDDAGFRRAVFAGYADRLARRRAPKEDRLVLASGTGARLARESGVHDAEFLVAVDVTAGKGGPRAEALVRLATRVEEEWITATSREVEHEIDAQGVVRALRRDRYDQLVMREHHVEPDPAIAARLVEEAYVRRGPSESDTLLLNRFAFAGVPTSFVELVRAASIGVTRLDDVDLAARLPPSTRAALDRDAPLTLKLPAGRVAKLQYRDDGRVIIATRLQDVFGMKETPRLGKKKAPVTFELLAPNGRAVQVTTDLASFWTKAYPEIRKELSRKYPKHRW